MTRQAIIDHTTHVINLLPPEKATEISNFADFISMKYEEQIVTENIQKIVAVSKAFNFFDFSLYFNVS